VPSVGCQLWVQFLRDLLVVLDRYAVSYRYPGQSAGKDEAQLAFRAVTDVRRFVRDKLGVSPEI
jgi:hypothetical protein